MSRDSERNVLTNLSVLSKMRAQDRLNVAGGMLYIVSAQTPLRSSAPYRMLTGNGRRCTIQAIDRLFGQVIELWHQLIGEGREVETLRRYVAEALPGVKHLIDVYHGDPTSVSRMQVISKQIEEVVIHGAARPHAFTVPRVTNGAIVSTTPANALRQFPA